MPADAPEGGHRSAGGDHGLGRDAVPQVGGATDDVPFDEGDLDTQAGGVGGRLVAGRASADDHEAHGHRLEGAGRGRPSAAVRQLLIRQLLIRLPPWRCGR